MALKTRSIRRYTAFFRGWAQAFGIHEKRFDETSELSWLVAEDDEQIGLMLTPTLKRQLFPCFLGHRGGDAPAVCLCRGNLCIGELEVPLDNDRVGIVSSALNLLREASELHLFQTYHLFYPSGTRILTLSSHAPMPLVYREIAPLTLELDRDALILSDPVKNAVSMTT